MKRIAVFPGSFDPITKGHEDIVKRSVPLFDQVVVAIGINSSKNYFFSLEKRMEFIRKTFENEPRIQVESYSGLTIEFCKSIGAQFILRGLRTSADFEFERGIAQMNKAMATGIETVFMLTAPGLSAINSTIVRDILRYGGDAAQFVPDCIELK